MDKEQARFILQCFRPDGADAEDHDFADALAVAIEDRELGAWLARERAFDATFAKAVANIELPTTLRENILNSLAAERGDIPQADHPFDRSMMSALATIAPDPALKMRILTAMNQSQSATMPTSSFWHRLAMPLAAAAGVALAFVVTNPHHSTPQTAAALKLPVDVVQANFIQAFGSPNFTLDLKREDHRELIGNLKARKLPCPCCLPPGLSNTKGVGCREFVINGKHGSVICFNEHENGPVHLIIFRREDVDDALPDKESPHLDQHGSWATASWQHGDTVCILIGEMDVDKLAALF